MVMGPRARTWWERQVKGWRRWWNDVGQRLPERIWLLWVVATVIFSRDFPSARYAVRKSATDQAPRDFGAWEAIHNTINFYPYLGENYYRNMEAVLWTHLHAKEMGRATVPLHRRQLLVELAYLALKERGR